MSHFAFKLNTGDMVYGILKERDDKIIVVENPLIFEEFVDSEGKVNTTLVKYIAASDETEIPILTSSIVSMAKMSKDFSDYYDASVEIQNVTQGVYNQSLKSITSSMTNYLVEYYAKKFSSESGELIQYPVSDNNDVTIH